MRKLFKGKEDLDLTGGPIGYSLFHLSLPIVIINLLRTAYNLADTFWLGRLSDEALAGITFAFPLVFLLIATGMGLAVAGSVLVAQYEGSRQRKMVDFAASQTVTFSILAAVLLGTFGYLFLGPIVGLLGAEAAVQPLAASYLRIISLGLFTMFGFAVFISLMRGYGDTVTPMLIMLGSVVLNIVLDPFLIFGWSVFPAMGIEGAAVATVFSRGLALAVGMGILLTGRRGIRVRLRQMVPDPSFLRKMLGIGIPASVDGAGRAISVNLLVAVVGMFSTTVVAGFGVGIRIFSMVFLPAMATARGVSAMTGQNVGAGYFDRAERTAYIAAKYMFLVLSGIGVIVFLFAESFMSVFTSSPGVIATGALFLKYTAPTFGFIGVMRAFTGGFRGAGKTLIAAALSIMMLGLIRLPLAYFGALNLGPEGIWLAFPVSNVAGAVIAFLWFRRGTWKEKVIEEDLEKGEVAEEVEEYGETITE